MAGRQLRDERIQAGRFDRPTTQVPQLGHARRRPGPSGEGGFPAEAGRYHLYVSLACPWAHRTMIFRQLKGLEDAISMSTVVAGTWATQGWTFDQRARARPAMRSTARASCPRSICSPIRATPAASRVPVLWDKKRRTIVNNESSEIIRMFNSAFDAFTNDAHRLLSGRAARRDRRDQRPASTRPSTTASTAPASPPRRRPTRRRSATLFATLDELERRLSRQRYLVGDRLTEADWRLFTTLIRFDAVYYGHFKCNLRRIVDYPNLSNYLRDLYQVPGVAETVSIDHIKRHYYGSQRKVNPTGIVPLGPELDFTAPHDRARLSRH